jgi:UDP-GlcNAc3NAcA epimerase
MPEEINRIVSDRISDVLFAPTLTAVRNLEAEGLKPITCFTGDVMYDSVLFYSGKINRDPGKFRINGMPDNYLLATIHRAENTDDPEKLNGIFEGFAGTGETIILPLHPRTKKIISNRIKLPRNVVVIEPVGYLQMLKLVIDSQKVLTDSGGLQKEAYFLGKPCITLRTETEWVETLHDNWNIIAGTDPDRIREGVNLPFPIIPGKNEFGTGNAAGLIADKLTSVA